jgi:hypothetical protein
MRSLCGWLLCGAAVLGGAAAAEPLRPSAVHPSGAVVPANLLRISIVFTEPVGDAVLSRLKMVGPDGYVIEKPFLEEELWSPSRRILTVLLHPGRVKSGLIAHETAGPVLRAEQSVVLQLDGAELKRWTVAEDDHDGPKPAAWRVGAVRVGTRQPLTVDLDGPIEARDVDYLAVADAANRRVRGSARLEPGERRWTFTPQRPWQATTYKLAVFGNLEDASGNRLGSHFESGGGAHTPQQSDVVIPLTVVRAPRQ